MLKSKAFATAILISSCTVAAETPKPKPDPSATMGVEIDVATIGPPPGMMAGVIARYEADRGSVMRSAPPVSSTSHDELIRRFDESWLKAIESLDFGAMNLGERVDYLLLKNRLKYDLRKLAIEAKNREEVAPLVPFAAIILDLDASRRRMEHPDGAKAATALNTLVKAIDEAKTRVEKGFSSDGKDGPKPSKAVGHRATATVRGLRHTLRETISLSEGYDPLFTWWTAEPFKAADKAIEGYETFLREKVVGLKLDDKTTIVGDPIGRDALKADLDSAMIPYTPEELISIAEKRIRLV